MAYHGPTSTRAQLKRATDNFEMCKNDLDRALSKIHGYSKRRRKAEEELKTYRSEFEVVYARCKKAEDEAYRYRRAYDALLTEHRSICNAIKRACEWKDAQ